MFDLSQEGKTIEKKILSRSPLKKWKSTFDISPESVECEISRHDYEEKMSNFLLIIKKYIDNHDNFPIRAESKDFGKNYQVLKELLSEVEEYAVELTVWDRLMDQIRRLFVK